MASQEQKDKIKAGVRARQSAVAALIANHQEEFERLHARFRTDAGLTPTASGPSREQLEERIAKQRQRLARWEEQLRLSS